MQKPAALCVIALGMWFAITDAVMAEDLASLREKITNNLATIGSIEVRYQRIANPKATDPVLLKYYALEKKPQTGVWAKQGDREFHEVEAYSDPVSNRNLQMKASFDGQQYVEFHYSDQNPDMVVSVDVRNKPPLNGTTKNALPPLFIGLRVGHTQMPLLELLKRHTTRYLGPEEIEGNLCHKIEFGELDSHTDYVHALTIWFDPKFDFLPRKIENLAVRQISTAKPLPPFGDRHLVTEFCEVDDLALKRKRWFPKRILGTAPMEVLEARINPAFDVSRFTLKIPDGVHVLYRDQRAPIPGTTRTRMRAEISGGATGIEIARKRSAENDLKMQAERIQANQRVESARQLQIGGIAAVAVLAFVSVIVVVWKRSRQRS